MDPEFNPEQWANFFVAETGATAALAGLVIVAISINLKAIVSGRLLSGRAAETVAMLGCILILSTLVLVPKQSLTILGGEILILGMATASLNARILIRARHLHHDQEARWVRVVLALGVTLPLLLCGASLLAQPHRMVPGGLYWLVPTVVFGLVGGLLSSWVLLVEILR